MRLRRLLLTAHLLVGSISAPFLIVLGLTGAVLVFEDKIDDALNARLTLVEPGTVALPLDSLARRVSRSYPGYRLVSAFFPRDRRHAYALGFLKPGTSDEGVGLLVNQYTGRILGTDDQMRAPMQVVHQLHTRLLAGRSGASILGWMSLALVFLSVSGLVLWWPGRIFTFRRTDGGWRLMFNLHNALGAYAWIFLLLFGVTGAVIHWDRPARSAIDRLAGTTAPSPAPALAPECAGRPLLPPDRLLAAANSVVPEAVPSRLQFGPGSTGVVHIGLRLPEDLTPGGRTLVTMASCTGRVLEAIDSRTASPGYRYTALWNREIHTGDVFGWPSRILACLFSLALPLMAVTGPVMWLQRRQRRE